MCRQRIDHYTTCNHDIRTDIQCPEHLSQCHEPCKIFTFKETHYELCPNCSGSTSASSLLRLSTMTLWPTLPASGLMQNSPAATEEREEVMKMEDLGTKGVKMGTVSALAGKFGGMKVIGIKRSGTKYGHGKKGSKGEGVGQGSENKSSFIERNSSEQGRALVTWNAPGYTLSPRSSVEIPIRGKLTDTDTVSPTREHTYPQSRSSFEATSHIPKFEQSRRSDPEGTKQKPLYTQYRGSKEQYPDLEDARKPQKYAQGRVYALQPQVPGQSRLSLDDTKQTSTYTQHQVNQQQRVSPAYKKQAPKYDQEQVYQLRPLINQRPRPCLKATHHRQDQESQQAQPQLDDAARTRRHRQDHFYQQSQSRITQQLASLAGTRQESFFRPHKVAQQQPSEEIVKQVSKQDQAYQRPNLVVTRQDSAYSPYQVPQKSRGSEGVAEQIRKFSSTEQPRPGLGLPKQRYGYGQDQPYQPHPRLQNIQQDSSYNQYSVSQQLRSSQERSRQASEYDGDVVIPRPRAPPMPPSPRTSAERQRQQSERFSNPQEIPEGYGVPFLKERQAGQKISSEHYAESYASLLDPSGVFDDADELSRQGGILWENARAMEWEALEKNEEQRAIEKEKDRKEPLKEEKRVQEKENQGKEKIDGEALAVIRRGLVKVRDEDWVRTREGLVRRTT